VKLEFPWQIFEKQPSKKFGEIRPAREELFRTDGQADGQTTKLTVTIRNIVRPTKTIQLMLYREIIAVCSEIRTKHINTVCGQNVELLNVKLVAHIVTTGL